MFVWPSAEEQFEFHLNTCLMHISLNPQITVISALRVNFTSVEAHI